MGSDLMLGSSLPETKSSTKAVMDFSVIFSSWEKGNFWFLSVRWMAKAGNLPISRLRLPACWPKAFASMVAKLMAPLCFWARGFSSLTKASRSSCVSAKM